MSEQQPDTPPSELQALRRDYRALKAPAFLETRVRAGVIDRQARHSRRRPLLIAVAVAIAMLAIVPFIARHELATPPVSMAALPMGLTSVRLPPPPSLTKLRSVSTPALPPRPARPQPDTSGKSPEVQTHNPWQKENTHEVT